MMHLLYVHLGLAECSHLLSSIERTHTLFPQYQLHLVVSPGFKISEFPSYLEIHTYVASEETEEIFKEFAHDTHFRQGFWRFSLERILAIKVVHDTFPGDSILHIESDVLLMPNFPFTEISLSNNLMWNAYNSDHDVSALLFSPNSNSTENLILRIKLKLIVNPNLTDMTVLNEIWRNSELQVMHFSSIHPSLPEMINPKAEEYAGSEISSGYGGIFDGAAIGMWLFGHDPKNNYGKSIIHSNLVIESGNSYVDPSSVNYELDASGNLFAISKETNRKVPIWNLHIHSKNKKVLGVNWLPETRNFIGLASSPIQIVHMDWSVLWNMFFLSLKTGTFFRFILGIPKLQPLRRRMSPIKRLVRNLSKH